MRLHWWLIKIDSGNGLVSFGNKPYMWTNDYQAMGRHMASLSLHELMINREII